MKFINGQFFSSSYKQLNDIAYYFTTGAEFVSRIDSHDLDPVLAQIFENIQPLALEIEPYAKQLWCHLEQKNKN